MKNKKLRKIVTDLREELQALEDIARASCWADEFYAGSAVGKQAAYARARKLLEAAFADMAESEPLRWKWVTLQKKNGRLYFVDEEHGNDSNDGLSEKTAFGDMARRPYLPGCILTFHTREAEVNARVKFYGNGVAVIPCADDDPEAIGTVVSRDVQTATVILEKPVYT